MYSEATHDDVYNRFVSKDVSFFYLTVNLLFDESTELDVDAFQFKMIIIQAVESLFGEKGIATPVDVLQYDSSSRTGLLRVHSIGLIKLWSSLTLLGVYQGCDCAFHITKVSSYLPAMGTSSRVFIHGQA